MNPDDAHSIDLRTDGVEAVPESPWARAEVATNGEAPHGQQATGSEATGLTRGQARAKRGLDLVVAVLTLALFGWLILLGAAVSALAHGGSGFFVQRRVGRHGTTFPLLKLQTMRTHAGAGTTVTTARDPRITSVGRLLRRTKLEELPQFVNVLRGEMSLVGPRPDVPGFADRLEGDDRIVLSVAPGITGPATLAYRDEEELLATQDEPERYNRDVIYPAKVRLNRAYVLSWSFWGDLRYLWLTAAGKRQPRGDR